MKKIIILAVTCIVSVCCLFFVKADYNAVAETEQVELKITNYNLAFMDSVYIMYAVENNVEDYENIKVLVWKTPQEEYTKGTEETCVDFYENEEIYGKVKATFIYDNLTAKEMTDYVYARPYYFDGENDYYGEVVKYSVLTYSQDRLNNSTNDSFKQALKAMLDYGSAIQLYQNYHTERLANDTYYTVEVTNGTLLDGFSSGLYKKDDTIELKSESDVNVTVKWYNEKNEFVNTQIVPIYMLTEGFTLSYETEYASKGLTFTLNADKKSYTVTGKGTCNDIDLVIPSTYNGLPVTIIGYNAFNGCSGLTSITIGNGVTSIGGGAFYDCSGLTSVTISNSVTSIGRSAFMGCSGLTSVTIGNGVTSIGQGVFCDCSGLTSIEIPNSVTSIGSHAFMGCSGLTSIEIPNSVTSIERYAFAGCLGLKSIDIPNSVTSIGYSAFYYCSGLTSIEIASGNTVYHSKDNCIIETATNTLILGCKNSIIPKYVTSIGDYAFEGCDGLTSVTIPNSVTSIGDWAFSECTGLTSITIGNSVTSIGDYAFSGCTGLTSIEVASGNTVYHSKDNCIIEIATNTLILGCKNSIIPKYVTSIGNRAFQSCSGLTSITIPSSVILIGESAFYGCSGLTSITIPNSVTSIGYSAFYYCSGLTSIEIPDSVTSIGREAFYYCSKLKSITFSDTSTWYRTTNYTNWENKSGGAQTGVTNSSTNATYFTSKYATCYWYKK